MTGSPTTVGESRRASSGRHATIRRRPCAYQRWAMGLSCQVPELVLVRVARLRKARPSSNAIGARIADVRYYGVGRRARDVCPAPLALRPSSRACGRRRPLASPPPSTWMAVRPTSRSVVRQERPVPLGAAFPGRVRQDVHPSVLPPRRQPPSPGPAWAPSAEPGSEYGVLGVFESNLDAAGPRTASPVHRSVLNWKTLSAGWSHFPPGRR